MKYLIMLIIFTSCASGVKKKVEPVVEKVPVNRIVNFTIDSKLTWVSKVAACANAVIVNEDFQSELIAREKFDYSDDNGTQVLSNMLTTSGVIKTYSKRFSKAVAYTKKKVYPTTIFLNRAKTSRTSMKGWVATALHELSHLAHYSHGTNGRAGKEDSVPYFLTAMAKKYAVSVCGF